MANYISFFRSSYFRPKDKEAFIKFCEEFELEVWTEKSDTYPNLPRGEELVAFGSSINNENGIPNWRYNEETDENEDIDFMQELSKHLAEGWAVEVREIGYEKLRYLVGYVCIVDWRGNEIWLNLDDINEKLDADPKFENIRLTACEY